jgi:hypothetical protein
MSRGIVIFVLAAACRSQGVGPPGEAQLLLPATVDFGACPKSAQIHRRVQLANGSRTPADVTLTLTGPFTLGGSATVHLQGSATLDLDVVFQPAAEGPAHGTLTAGTATALLTGQGIAECTSSDTCHTSAFDPVAQTCTSGSRADGAACTSRCVVGGTCSGGVCYGAAPSCDDGDGCTVDACDETGACLHLPRTCPVTQSCTLAYCDPSTGACAATPLDDGTRCGAETCGTAKVCIAGACVERARPGVDEALDCRYQDLALGEITACAVTARGRVKCWGGSTAIEAAGGRASSLYMRPPEPVFDSALGYTRAAVASSGLCATGPGQATCAPWRWADGGLDDAQSIALDEFDVSVGLNACVIDSHGGLTCYDDANPQGLRWFDGGVVAAQQLLGESGYALRSDGTLDYWGADGGPVSMPGLGPLVAIAGRRCALDALGALACAGTNFSPVDVFYPVVDGGVRAASSGWGSVWYETNAGTWSDDGMSLPWTDAVTLHGESTVCALRASGTIECAGYNQSGMLGMDTLVLPPTPLDAGSIDRVVVAPDSVAAFDGEHVSFIHSSRRNALPALDGVRDVAASSGSMLVLTTSGAAQLYYGAPNPDGGADTVWAPGGRLSNITAIAGSWSPREFVTLSDSGRADLWWYGDPFNPQLQGSLDVGPARALVTSYNLVPICALFDDGGVQCASLDAGNAVGPMQTVPLPGPAQRVVAYGLNACAVVAGHGLWCWGEDLDAGADPTVPSWVRDTVLADHLQCVLLGSNGVSCRGTNGYGQLGNRGRDSASWVGTPIGETVDALATDGITVCAVTHSHNAVCWGFNGSGQLGIEPLEWANQPVRIDP